MKEIYKVKKQLQELYYSKSRYVDIVIKFLVNLMVFMYINNHVGYMTSLAKFPITFVLALICSILPYGILLFVSPLLIVFHVFTESMALAACVMIVFLFMFIVYLRFTADKALIVVLTPIALGLKLGYIVPIVCGLLVGPVAILPVACGVVTYNLINIVQGLSVTGELSVDGMLSDALGFASACLENKEVMFYIIVFSATICVVYAVKQLPLDHVWKIAIGAGALTSIISAMMIKGTLEIEVSIVSIFFANVFAAVIGLVIELIFMGVDYKKTEVVEFEDDEYHYYVKAVPKIVEEGRKTKRRQRDERLQEPETIELEENLELEVGVASDDTMIIESDEIERQLRENANIKSKRSGRNKERHTEANYQMLQNSMEEFEK